MQEVREFSTLAVFKKAEVAFCKFRHAICFVDYGRKTKNVKKLYMPF
jgi:hypothetical protein